MMTREQKIAFIDKTAELLRKQGKRAVTQGSEPMCVYRTPDGCGCAIGVHVPPDVPVVEGIISARAAAARGGCAVSAGMFRHLGGADYNSEPDVDFLQDVQRCHDSGYARDGRTDLEDALFRLDLLKNQVAGLPLPG